MRLYLTLALIALMFPRIANAQSAFGAQDGTRVPGAVLECATTEPTIAVPCGIDGAPLKVDEGSALVLPPGGGAGVIGFLAAIYNAMTVGLTVEGGVSVINLPAIQSVSGSVATTDSGNAIRGALVPGGGSGLTGWLSAIWSQLSGTMNVLVTNLPSSQAVTGSVSVSNFPVTQQVGGLVTSMDAGTTVSGTALPSGGSGVTGWLSAIWAKLAGTLSVSVGNWPTTQAVSGTVITVPPVGSVSDCSTTLTVPGSAYQVVSSGTTRKSILIQNLGGSNAGVSLTGTSPSIGMLGTFTLVPNASVQLAPGMVTSNPVYATGSAASQFLACTVFQ